MLPCCVSWLLIQDTTGYQERTSQRGPREDLLCKEPYQGGNYGFAVETKMDTGFNHWVALKDKTGCKSFKLRVIKTHKEWTFQSGNASEKTVFTDSFTKELLLLPLLYSWLWNKGRERWGWHATRSMAGIEPGKLRKRVNSPVFTSFFFVFSPSVQPCSHL